MTHDPRDNDEGVSSVVGTLMLAGMTAAMMGPLMLGAIQFAESTRDLAEAQAKENRETQRCIEGGAPACAPDDTRVKCWTNSTMNGSKTTCITQPANTTD